MTTSKLDVLIVEDSENDTELMVRALRRYGYDVDYARVETESEMRAELERVEWNLVLADYRLPGFSGPAALELVRTSGVDVPFILVSGSVGEEAAVAMMKSGAHDFVLKGSLGRLGAAVERELREAEMRHKRRRAEGALELLAETSKLFVDAVDYLAVLRRAARLAVPTLADWCVVWAREPHASGFVFETASIMEADEQPIRRFAQTYLPAFEGREDPLTRVFRTHNPYVSSDLEHDEWGEQEVVASLKATRVRSVIIVPLLARNTLVGLWLFASRRVEPYAESDLALAMEVGNRVALGLENARLTRAREEFISTAIHEIKTPIAVIKTAVQLMQQAPEPDRQRRLPDMLARIDRQCTRMDRLVSNVLHVSRIDLARAALVPETRDLAALVGRVVDEMQGVSPRHRILVSCDGPLDAPFDPDWIEQVLTNLIDNAIKYSPEGGDIDVTCSGDDAHVTVAVRDRGIGIPREQQPRIFERFFRAHAGTAYDHAGSLGVGLYLAREFVLRHGGEMWFESNEGVGSTFRFSLPRQPRQEASA